MMTASGRMPIVGLPEMRRGSLTLVTRPSTVAPAGISVCPLSTTGWVRRPRKGSPTLGKWAGVEASAETRRQVWAPAGFARGFCALSDGTEIQYKCTGIYSSKAESAIRWDDPAIGIQWPLADVTVSDKDRNAATMAEWLRSPDSDNFRYSEQEVELLVKS